MRRDSERIYTVCILSQQVARTNAILFHTFCRHKSCSIVQLAQNLFRDLKRSIPICQTMEASTKEQLELEQPVREEQEHTAPQPVRPARLEPAQLPLYRKPHMTTVRRSLKSLLRPKTM